jgi:hypothetical protein
MPDPSQSHAGMPGSIAGIRRAPPTARECPGRSREPHRAMPRSRPARSPARLPASRRRSYSPEDRARAQRSAAVLLGKRLDCHGIIVAVHFQVPEKRRDALRSNGAGCRRFEGELSLARRIGRLFHSGHPHLFLGILLSRALARLRCPRHWRGHQGGRIGRTTQDSNLRVRAASGGERFYLEKNPQHQRQFTSHPFRHIARTVNAGLSRFYPAAAWRLLSRSPFDRFAGSTPLSLRQMRTRDNPGWSDRARSA